MVEKEVDAAIAMDLVSITKAECDVAILWTEDGDLRPAVRYVIERMSPDQTDDGVQVHLAGWQEQNSKPHLLTPRSGRWPGHYAPSQHRMFRSTYRRIRDDRDYAAVVAQRGVDDLERHYNDDEPVDGRLMEIPESRTGVFVRVVSIEVFVPVYRLIGGRQVVEEFNKHRGTSRRFVVRGVTTDTVGDEKRSEVKLEELGLNEWRAEQKDRLLDELHEGEIRAGRITSIRPFGVFVDLGGADGLAHLSELSWERDVDPEQMFTIGQEVNVYITKIDKESKKIGLSIRRASPEQWDEMVAKFEVGQIVASTVTKLVTFGAFARIEGSVEGLVHVSELADRRIAHPREVVDDGDVIPVKIVRIERDRHRLGLSLRQARSDAERAGWRFDSEGRIVRLPDDVAEQFGVEPDQPWLRSG